MSVKFEVKGSLARLLATEDLVVEHKKVETACFNVHTRVLTLPMWEKASDNIYTMLVLHEISHALWTPNYDWTKEYNIPGQFVNICEDARVEKLCKRKYPGSPKSFYRGYKELADQDFFQIADEEIDEMNLADRANLWFKIGNFTDILIDRGEETEIINMIADSETFTDVLNAAEVLYKYCKKKQQEETQIQLDNHESQQDDDQPVSDLPNHQEGENDQPESDGSDGVPSGETSQHEQDEEPEVKTVDSLEEALKDLVNNSSYENVYLELPQLDLKKVIVSNSEIHSKCKETWEAHLINMGYSSDEIFGAIDKQFNEFKRSAQKEVNYLVKEFECHKAADSYARATTARTGVLDCSRLHTYKYNEDLFKKVTTLADGKNHGLVFVIDWSGSMGNVMLDTVKQLFNLVWFCKKVSIPFDVYAFTTDYPLVTYDENGKANLRELAYQKRDGLIQVGEWFSMMNLLTSKVNAWTLEEQMKNIFRISASFRRNFYNYKYPVPLGMSLSGTPLNEALISLHQILPKFQKENKLQKVQCVVLTDGEACPLKYHRELQRKWEEKPYIGISHIGSNAFIRDRKMGNTYSLNCEWYEFTDVLLRNLRDRFTDINFIGIRVLESRDAGQFIRRYYGYYGSDYEKLMSAWKKEKAFSIKKSGYHSYFGLSANALSQNTEFDVEEDATKSQIKSAFMKSLKSKKMNKKILGEFVKLVA